MNDSPSGSRQLPLYDPAGSDEDFPAQCYICGADAVRTTELRPSGYGFKVICSNDHLTLGMPRKPR